MKQPDYIFDVDGVLNDVESYQTDGRVIGQLAELLEHGAFVAINTGRGYAWIEKTVVQPIRSAVKDKIMMAHLFVAVEMGGLGIEFTNGAEQRTRSAFSLTPEQVALVRRTFNEHPEYADRIHWYEGKETMATLDKQDGTTQAMFRPAQHELAALLKAFFKDQRVTIASNNDALDIHAPEAGKWAGAQLVYDWLRRVTDIEHDQFICFGDSSADYEMARFFAGQNHDTTFVFTGPAFNVPTVDPNVTLIKTEQPYHEGTYQYLRTQEQLH